MLQLRTSKALQHQHAATLDCLDSRASRSKTDQSTLCRCVVVADTSSVRAQLAAHQRHTRADVPPQMFAISTNEVGLGSRTQVDHQASTLGQVESAQRREPAIHA
ncbi:hypothetical protein D3C81_1602920 [compost metagenome]